MLEPRGGFQWGRSVDLSSNVLSKAGVWNHEAGVFLNSPKILKWMDHILPNSQATWGLSLNRPPSASCLYGSKGQEDQLWYRGDFINKIPRSVSIPGGSFLSHHSYTSGGVGRVRNFPEHWLMAQVPSFLEPLWLKITSNHKRNRQISTIWKLVVA